MKTINYSEFLFNKLVCEFNEDFAVLEYDRQFDAITPAYLGFEKSVFNVPEKSEYLCMCEYLSNVYNIPTPQTPAVKRDIEMQEKALQKVKESELFEFDSDKERNTIISCLVDYYDHEQNTEIGKVVLECITKIITHGK